MSRDRFGWMVLPVAVWLLSTAAPQASTVMQLNLGEMVQRADRIYRGTVLSVDSGTVSVGGGELPITIYRLRVDEAFRGDFTEVKGMRIAEIRTLGKLVSRKSGALRSVVVLPQMPALETGGTYLVMTTRASAIGLSTSVGLGQGVFRIQQVGKEEQAVNEANNSGLFRSTPAPAVQGARSAAPGLAAPATDAVAGPISYADLAGRIRGLVRR
jgi:hypothetical protein